MKVLLRDALTDQIDDREVYMKGIDVSYYYEGYHNFKTEELQTEKKGILDWPCQRWEGKVYATDR